VLQQRKQHDLGRLSALHVITGSCSKREFSTF